MKIKRRHFISTFSGLTGLIIPSPVVFGNTSLFKKGKNDSTKKELHVAIDIYGDLTQYHNVSGKLYDKSHISDLMKYVKRLGASRVEWIISQMWNLYDEDAYEFDLLQYAVDCAHENNLEFFAVIKPFEGSFDQIPLPHTFPKPSGVPLLENIRGLTPVVEPFLYNNPDLRLKRYPGNWDVPGKLTSVRLVKNNTEPTRIRQEHLSIWTSKTNNNFQIYKGPLYFRETIELRTANSGFWKESRIIHLEGLDIPIEHIYVVVRCSLKNEMGDFTNERRKVIELVNEHGHEIPSTPCEGPVNYVPDQQFPPLWHKITRYGRHPEIQKFFSNPEKVAKHYENMYYFDDSEYLTKPHTIDQLGWVGAARGKNEYLVGNLSPVYSKVQEYWLEKVKYCIDRKVDGVNFRLANHTRSHEKWEYGFNETAEHKINKTVNVADVAKINGKAYTQFLQKARKLLNTHDLKMGVHLNANLLHPDDRGAPNRIPDNFNFEWRFWLNELADYAEIRGISNLLPWNQRRVLDTFSSATRDADIPLVYQSIKGGSVFQPKNGSFYELEEEISYVCDNKDIDAYLLYEIKNFTRIDENGRLEGSEEIINLIKSKFFKS